MEVLQLFEILSNSDTVEGKGCSIVHGYTASEGLARLIVADQRFARYCVMGVQSPNDHIYMVNKKTIKIYDHVNEFFENTKEEIKKRALAKLDPEERDALGL